ncbi:hypothetical protein FRC17_010251 [Serendipita sp. 399]|nr:hypothetical protein FRC17_010251 [Serendipita sp. 399]
MNHADAKARTAVVKAPREYLGRSFALLQLCRELRDKLEDDGAQEKIHQFIDEAYTYLKKLPVTAKNDTNNNTSMGSSESSQQDGWDSIKEALRGLVPSILAHDIFDKLKEAEDKDSKAKKTLVEISKKTEGFRTTEIDLLIVDKKPEEIILDHIKIKRRTPPWILSAAILFSKKVSAGKSLDFYKVDGSFPSPHPAVWDEHEETPKKLYVIPDRGRYKFRTPNLSKWVEFSPFRNIIYMPARDKHPLIYLKDCLGRLQRSPNGWIIDSQPVYCWIENKPHEVETWSDLITAMKSHLDSNWTVIGPPTNNAIPPVSNPISINSSFSIENNESAQHSPTASRVPTNWTMVSGTSRGTNASAVVGIPARHGGRVDTTGIPGKGTEPFNTIQGISKNPRYNTGPLAWPKDLALQKSIPHHAILGGAYAESPISRPISVVGGDSVPPSPAPIPVDPERSTAIVPPSSTIADTSSRGITGSAAGRPMERIGEEKNAETTPQNPPSLESNTALPADSNAPRMSLQSYNQDISTQKPKLPLIDPQGIGTNTSFNQPGATISLSPSFESSQANKGEVATTTTRPTALPVDSAPYPQSNPSHHGRLKPSSYAPTTRAINSQPSTVSHEGSSDDQRVGRRASDTPSQGVELTATLQKLATMSSISKDDSRSRQLRGRLRENDDFSSQPGPSDAPDLDVARPELSKSFDHFGIGISGFSGNTQHPSAAEAIVSSSTPPAGTKQTDATHSSSTSSDTKSLPYETRTRHTGSSTISVPSDEKDLSVAPEAVTKTRGGHSGGHRLSNDTAPAMPLPLSIPPSQGNRTESLRRSEQSASTTLGHRTVPSTSSVVSSTTLVTRQSEDIAGTTLSKESNPGVDQSSSHPTHPHPRVVIKPEPQAATADTTKPKTTSTHFTFNGGYEAASSSPPVLLNKTQTRESNIFDSPLAGSPPSGHSSMASPRQGSSSDRRLTLSPAHSNSRASSSSIAMLGASMLMTGVVVDGRPVSPQRPQPPQKRGILQKIIDKVTGQ